MRAAAVALLAILSSACTTFSVNKAEVAKVKAAAVIGFGADLSDLEPTDDSHQVRIGGVYSAVTAVEQLRRISDGRWGASLRLLAALSYGMLVERLAREMRWQMPTADATSSNEVYLEAYEDRVASKWGADSTQAFGPHLYVRGIMWDRDAKRLEAEDREELMDALGVDALAVVTIRFRIGRITGFGRGAGYVRPTGPGNLRHYPQATIELLVYNRTDPDPIWHDEVATGDVAREGFADARGFAATQDSVAIMLEAVRLGLDALMARFREAETGR